MALTNYSNPHSVVTTLKCHLIPLRIPAQRQEKSDDVGQEKAVLPSHKCYHNGKDNCRSTQQKTNWPLLSHQI